VFALHLGERLFLFAEKAGVGNLFPSRERGKGGESNVNPHSVRIGRQAFRFTLNREASVPLASTALVDGQGFDLATMRAMVDHLDPAYFGQADVVIVGDGKARLWEREAIIAPIALKAGISWVFCPFMHAVEKCLKGQFNTLGHILQHLRMDQPQSRTFCFEYWKTFLRIIP
jgi:hypothetical protein